MRFFRTASTLLLCAALAPLAAADEGAEEVLANRPGQTRPVEHIHLLAEHTVDEKVMTALSRRAGVVRAVLQQMKGKP